MFIYFLSLFLRYACKIAFLCWSFNVLKSLFAKYGCDIVVLNDIDNEKQIEKEIFEEIITLLHYFSTKMYSNRRKEKLNLIKKELELENSINIE